MKNMLISLNNGSPIQRNKITDHLSAAGYAYWHWIDDLWIAQVPDHYSPKLLHQKLEASDDFGMPTMLILEIGFGTKHWGRANDKAWEWLSKISSPG